MHAAQRYISYALVAVILIYVVGLGVTGQIPAEFFNLVGTFQVGPFLAVLIAAAAYQLTWAFFVSDYSRYMPADTKRSTIVAITSGGLFFGLFSFMAIGAIAASLMPSLLESSPGLAARLDGDATGFAVSLVETGKLVFPGLGELVLIAGGLGLIGLMAMCVYGGSLTLITALDSIRPVRPTRRIRVITILIVGLTGAVAAALVPTDFLNNNLYTVLIVLAYLMGPWTAVNLTDFFFVRRGHYSVREMFRRGGMYGLWSWRGIVAYVAAVVAMLPFMYIGGLYEGPIAVALGGVDIAFFVGIPVGWRSLLVVLPESRPRRRARDDRVGRRGHRRHRGSDRVRRDMSADAAVRTSFGPSPEAADDPRTRIRPPARPSRARGGSGPPPGARP